MSLDEEALESKIEAMSEKINVMSKQVKQTEIVETIGKGHGKPLEILLKRNSKVIWKYLPAREKKNQNQKHLSVTKFNLTKVVKIMFIFAK